MSATSRTANEERCSRHALGVATIDRPRIPMIQVLVDSVTLGSVYVLFALGLSLAWGVLNLLNLAYGATFMLGAFFAYLVTERVTLPLLVLAPIAMLCTALLSVSADILIFRRLREAKSGSDAGSKMMVASIGLAAIPVAIVERTTSVAPVRLPREVFKVRSFHVASQFRVTNIQIIMVIVTIVLATLLGVAVRRSRWGRSLRGVALDADTAELLGINTRFVYASTMAISGAMAGLAGVLLSVHLNYIDSAMGAPLLLKAFAIIIIGGVGSIGGAVIGGYLLATTETAIVAYGPTEFREAIAFILILVVLLVRPTGIFVRAKGERS